MVFSMKANGWFGKKRIGWGIGPRRWQGWLVMAIYAVTMIALPRVVDRAVHPWLVGGGIAVLSIALLTIVILKFEHAEHRRP